MKAREQGSSGQTTSTGKPGIPLINGQLLPRKASQLFEQRQDAIGFLLDGHLWKLLWAKEHTERTGSTMSNLSLSGNGMRQTPIPKPPFLYHKMLCLGPCSSKNGVFLVMGLMRVEISGSSSLPWISGMRIATLPAFNQRSLFLVISL